MMEALAVTVYRVILFIFLLLLGLLLFDFIAFMTVCVGEGEGILPPFVEK